MDRRRPLRSHLEKGHGHATARDLPCGLGACQPGADDRTFLHGHETLLPPDGDHSPRPRPRWTGRKRPCTLHKLTGPHRQIRCLRTPGHGEEAMRVGRWIAFGLVAAVALAPVFAKKDKKADAPASTTTGAQADSGDGDSTPAAMVGNETITMADVDRAAANQLTKIRQQEYDIRRQTLQQLVNDKLVAAEAAARKVSADDLLKQEVDAKAPAVTDDEAQQYYDRMKGRMAGKTFDEVKADIIKNLGMQKQFERKT